MTLPLLLQVLKETYPPVNITRRTRWQHHTVRKELTPWYSSGKSPNRDYLHSNTISFKFSINESISFVHNHDLICYTFYPNIN